MPTLADIIAAYQRRPSTLNVPDQQAYYTGNTDPGMSPTPMDLTQQPRFSWQSQLASGAKGFLGDRDLALALLSNSGWSHQPRGFGEILGTSMLQADQAKTARQQQAFQNEFNIARLKQLQSGSSTYGAVQPDKFTPESLAKFEQSGKYSDLQIRPVGQLFGRYNPGDYTPESWAKFRQTGDETFLERYVAPQNASVENVNGVPTVVQPDRRGGPTRVSPLTTQADEFDAAKRKKQAEAEGAATGEGTGKVNADIIKKGTQAANVTDLLDIAEPLIAVSTGSSIGAAADSVAAFFGKSLDGATAIARLKTLQGQLIAQMPRMEGPQSDADRLLYQQAAGDIANPKVPVEQRQAAAQTIRQLQEKYRQRASQVQGRPSTTVVNWADLP